MDLLHLSSPNLVERSQSQIRLICPCNKYVLCICSAGSMSFPTISSIKSCNAAEHEQGSVQGALYGARALASGKRAVIALGV